MYAFFSKYGQALAFGIGVIVVILFMLNIFVFTDGSELEALSNESKDPEFLKQKYSTGAFNFGIYMSLILIAIAFLVAIAFGFIQLAGDPKGSLKGIAGAIGLLVICGLCYAAANGTVADEPAEIVKSIEKFETDQQADFTGSTLKLVSGGIIATLVLIGISVALLVVSVVRDAVK